MIPLDFDIAVFAVNEAATIIPCVEAIDAACAGHSARISVLLNGTTDDTAELLKNHELKHASMTVFLFNYADKANAINHYIYSIRRPASIVIGIDAYTKIAVNSFVAMQAALDENPNAYIASGIPISGRSARSEAEATMKGGKVNGQLYAMRPDFLDRIVDAGFKLPLQIYRGDPLLGSMAAHDLNPVQVAWDQNRIIGVGEAQFELRPLSVLKWRDIRRQHTREIRQARGRMENAAIKEIIFREGYDGLPDNANDMLKSWLTRNKPEYHGLREAYFTRLALRQLQNARNIAPVRPRVVHEFPPEGD